MEFVFVRHGITVNLEGNRIQGWGPTPLSDRGRQQAQAAANRLRSEGRVTAIYTSPVARTAETAGIIGQTLELPVQEFWPLAERRMPSRFWGARRDEILDYLQAFASHTRDADWAFEDEDSLRTSVNRAREVIVLLEQLATLPGRAVLVTHGTILRLIAATLLLDKTAPVSSWAVVHDSLLGPQPCAFAEVAPGAVRMAVRAWNDTAHLAGLLDFDPGPGA